MIKPTKILRLIEQSHRFAWVIQIPFIIYFGVTFFNIERMHSDIKLMESVLEKENHISKQNILDLYKNCEKGSQRKKHLEELYADVKDPLDFVLSEEFINSEDWLRETKQIEEDYLELLNDFNQYNSPYYNRSDENVFEITQREINWAERYPKLKKHIANKYGSQMVYILAGQLLPNCDMHLCSYFSPVIQKKNGLYYLYPYQENSCWHNDPKFKVNGELLEDATYVFKPERIGEHVLDVEFRYMFDGRMRSFYSSETLNVQ